MGYLKMDPRAKMRIKLRSQRIQQNPINRNKTLSKNNLKYLGQDPK
jgi:hypothetical protein